MVQWPGSVLIPVFIPPPPYNENSLTSQETQVTIEYRQDPSGHLIPLRVDTVVISTQHAEEITTEDLREQIMEQIIKAVIPKGFLDERTVYHIQPSGRFVIGGPQGDAGVTGRKIIVDTYGGWGAHGGGAFSGKVCQTHFGGIHRLMIGLLQGRSFGCLCCSLGCQVACYRWSLSTCSRPIELCHWSR